MICRVLTLVSAFVAGSGSVPVDEAELVLVEAEVMEEEVGVELAVGVDSDSALNIIATIVSRDDLIHSGSYLHWWKEQ